MTDIRAHERWSVCTCMRIDCWHETGRCEEPPVMRYGQCTTCRVYNPLRCPSCGQAVPENKEKKQ